MKSPLFNSLVAQIQMTIFGSIYHDHRQGELPGSSAGGEQPKFTALKKDPRGDLSHVIVKFSPKGDNDVAKRSVGVVDSQKILNQIPLNSSH